jgi:polynucleotide 5'-kinase involved in rRNA processing
MENNSSASKVSRKRKAKKRLKEKKLWKRSKLPTSRIFQEASFDSDSDESKNISGVKSYQESDFRVERFEPLKLTPSKSERESAEIVVSDFEVNNISSTVTENSFEISSDENDSCSYSYSSIIDEFIDENCGDDTEIISPVKNESKGKKYNKERTDSSLILQKKKIKIKKSKIKSVTNDSSTERVLEEVELYDEIKKNKNKTEDLSESGDIIVTSKSVGQDPQFYFTEEGTIVILDNDNTIYFNGLCKISVLQGEIEVLGYKITKNCPEMNMYSPRGTSLLYLKNITETDIPVGNYLLDSKLSNKIRLTKKCAIIMCKKLHDPNVLFVEKHMTQQILPKDDNFKLPRVVFQPKEGNWNFLKINPQWDYIIDGITKSTKMMICGGKGVGKTTFLRYAINRLLMRFNAVRIVDLDPGQSEFTVPGCISIVKVEKPVFGPNYTHLQASERSILSNINIAYEPDKYIASVKQLLHATCTEAPTLINYMGYTHGIGINILSAVIACVHPTDILQISSQDAKKNYKFLLSAEVVRENAKLFHSTSSTLDYNLHQIESMCDQNEGWTAESRQLREMCILSHVSNMTDSNSLFKTKSPLYKINLKHVNITDLRGDFIHPAAVNACLVALCTVEDELLNIFKCLGWGKFRIYFIFANKFYKIKF